MFKNCPVFITFWLLGSQPSDCYEIYYSKMHESLPLLVNDLTVFQGGKIDTYVVKSKL